ncbi:hypothetical protein B0I35DRAFT_413412 [Stachybotrys elegans]|uniref:N-acetyltransferase domain-containing protein n=1 Tax=Stachybotrys elegans TaxID=80388 RepID=A0A8K0SH76_9HYPO|nr:hypothetical protein B0I35DRAFT_413412 [Stachybotrys elegans]
MSWSSTDPPSRALRQKSWTRDGFLISTDASLLAASDVVAAFDRQEVYWTKGIPVPYMREMLDNSLCFGMYACAPATTEEASSSSSSPRREFIGLARCTTDWVSFVYLTDVWVSPACQGRGLGRWLMACVDEALGEMPYLRRTMLLTADWARSVPFYREMLGMELFGRGAEGEGIAARGAFCAGGADVYQGVASERREIAVKRAPHIQSVRPRPQIG